MWQPPLFVFDMLVGDWPTMEQYLWRYQRDGQVMVTPENVECLTCGGDRWIDNRCPCCNTNLGPKRCPDCTPENVETSNE